VSRLQHVVQTDVQQLLSIFPPKCKTQGNHEAEACVVGCASSCGEEEDDGEAKEEEEEEEEKVEEEDEEEEEEEEEEVVEKEGGCQT
jgi:hypothetical protein